MTNNLGLCAAVEKSNLFFWISPHRNDNIGFMESRATITHLDGWTDPGPDGRRWSIGPRSRICLDLSELLKVRGLEHDIALALDFTVRLLGDETGREFSFFVADVPVQQSTLCAGEHRNFELRFYSPALTASPVYVKVTSGSNETQGARLSLGAVRVRLCARELRSKELLIEAGRAASERIFSKTAEQGEDTAGLVAFIQERIAHAEPTSIVRLGDGEGRILGFDRTFSPLEVLVDCINYQYGPDALSAMIARGDDWEFSRSVEMLRRMIVDSIRNADAIGIPLPAHFNSRCDPATINGLAGFASAVLCGVPLLGHLVTCP